MLYYYKPLLAAIVLWPAALWAEPPRVVTDIAPVYALAARVMEGVAAPSLLLPPGASPHGYALRPSQARDLSEADLVIWIGPELTPWLDGALQTLAADAAHMPLLDVAGTLRLAVRETAVFDAVSKEDVHEHGDDHGDGHEDGHDHAKSHEDGHDHAKSHDAHDDDHAHDEAHDHDKKHDEHADAHSTQDDHGNDHAHDHGHTHSHEGTDPHAWLDPENGKVWLKAIAAALADKDPANRAQYMANAADAQAEIDAASARITQLLRPMTEAGFVVFHDAYQYFETRYDLEIAGAVTLGNGISPSAARIAALRDRVAQESIRCAFSEPQFNPKIIQVLADGAALKVAVLDPLGSRLEQGPDFYPALLEDLAAQIADCL